MLILTFQAHPVEWSACARYSSFHLYWNEEAATNQWGFSAEAAVHNIVPRIGFKVGVSAVDYEDIPFSGFSYAVDYVPLTFITSFDILPFLDTEWARLFLETGLGMYVWEGTSEGLTEEDRVTFDETNIGFIGGLTIHLRPVKYIGIDLTSRYHYVAGADIYEYGFEDTDDKLWENGVGLRVILP
jgi:hypothetical protein